MSTSWEAVISPATTYDIPDSMTNTSEESNSVQEAASRVIFVTYLW